MTYKFELVTIARTPKAVKVRWPNGRSCWLPIQVAEWIDNLRSQRDIALAKVERALRDLTCSTDAFKNGHGGMWCFTRAALPGPQCDCDNCAIWRALREADS